MHCWDDGAPIEETLKALNDLVNQGKIRYIGYSNVTGWHMQKIVDVSKYHGWAPVVSLQVIVIHTSTYLILLSYCHMVLKVSAIELSPLLTAGTYM